MIPINSINRFPISSFRFQNRPVATVSSNILHTVTRRAEPILPNTLNSISINQLPEDFIFKTTDIFRQIGIFAHQAAELGQTWENRELLQTNITEEISNLGTVLEELSQDNLKLFIAFFQNPSLIQFSDSNRDQDLFLNNFPENFPENFFHIDVTSELGSLAALDLTGTVIDILSEENSGSELLKSLLDNLTDSIFNLSVIQSFEQNQEDTSTDIDRDFLRLLVQNQYFTPIMSDSNPPTIIDMIG